MKIVSFRSDDSSGYGLVDDESIRPAPAELQARFPDLKSVLAAGALGELARNCAGTDPLPAGEISFESTIPNPSKIFCIGMNYMAHIKEMGREPPEYPTLFTRFPDSLVGHAHGIVRPRASHHFDYEGELAIVIGRTARHVAAVNALDFVAGYTCFLDGSVRDYQRHTSQFVAGKNFRHSGAMGPWLVTSDEIPDPKVLNLETRVSGETMQRGKISDLCFGVEQLIEYLSTICQLEAGDIIATGTPSGVGAARDPQRWLAPGDRVEIDIDGVGVLANNVVEET